MSRDWVRLMEAGAWYFMAAALAALAAVTSAAAAVQIVRARR